MNKENKDMQENKEIIINIYNSSSAIAFKENEIIHRNEFDKIKNEIQKRVDKLRNSNASVNASVNAFETITIYGSRGSGKTSFLKSVASNYAEDKDIKVINIIDPTMIEEKGHVFLTIISQIKIEVDKVFQNSNCSPREGYNCEKEKWQKCLRKLSAGLPSIEGVNATLDDWQDPEYVMNKGLAGVESAMSLAKNFHALVETALKILKKEMFILFLDDVDIDFVKGWPVLETVRKYLTTPKITTIVSGDLRLFSKAIRKQQWSNFGKALLINEADKQNRTSEYNDLVTEMEGQYLQKVLNPSHRIRLTTLIDKYKIDRNLKVKIKLTEQAKAVCLKEYYNNVLSDFGIHNMYQTECYLSFLLGLPLRTQIQFIIKTSIEENPMGVMEVFLSELYEKGVDIDLASSAPKFTTPIILETLIKHRVLDEGYQLQPISTDQILNGTYMAFTMLYSRLIPDNKFLIFDYLVKIGYVRNLLSMLGYKDNDRTRYFFNGRVSYSLSIDDLIKHSAITQDRNTRDAMCYLTAYMSAYFNPNGTSINYSSYAGVVVLKGLAEKSKVAGDEASKRLDGAFKKAKLIERQIAYIPASMSQGDKQATTFTYSIYVLLGAISEMIKVYSIDKNGLENSIQQMSQIRAYPMPNGVVDEDRSKDESEFGTDDNSITAEDTEGSSDLPQMITMWLDNADPKLIVSPHILGKISTRMYYNIKSIESIYKSTKAGDNMRRRIIATMNAILVEDIRENISANLHISNDNPVSEDKIFIENLKKINCHLDEGRQDKERLTFSRWMLSCPLFLLYLNYSNTELKDEIVKFTNCNGIYDQFDFVKVDKSTLEIICTDVFGMSIYDILNEVELRTKEDKVITKIEFSIAKGKIKQTIEAIFNKYSTYESFNSTSFLDLIPIIQPYFSNRITETKITQFKNKVVEQNLQW